jgi:hypothetical protein
MTREERSAASRKGAQARMQLPDWRDHQSAAGKARAAQGDMSAVGRRGYESSVGKYGHAGWLERSAKTRRARPTDLERQVAAILNRLGVAHEREYILFGDTQSPIVVDFALLGKWQVIEVFGRPHTEPGLNNGNPRGRAERDEARLRRLEEAGYLVLVIDHRQMSAAEERIRQFVFG